jgi:hypothetical protein
MKKSFLIVAPTLACVACSDIVCPTTLSCVPLSINVAFRSRPAAGTYTFKATGERFYECTVEITDANTRTYGQCASLYGSIRIVTEPERAKAEMTIPDYSETIDFEITTDQLVTAKTLTPTYQVSPGNECSPECMTVALAATEVP